MTAAGHPPTGNRGQVRTTRREAKWFLANEQNEQVRLGQQQLVPENTAHWGCAWLAKNGQ
jgi:hypothetical protein